MPTYIIRNSPEMPEYLLWSTVVDAPTSETMTRDEMIAVLEADLPVDRDLAREQAIRRVDRTDEQGSSERETVSFGYDCDRFWWREDAPAGFGEPYEDEDDPGTFIGRIGTRDDLFRICRQWR